MYTVRHWWGKEEREVPAERFAEILAELKAADSEHSTTSLKHESEWVLSYCKTGVLVYENVEEGDPRHMAGVPASVVVELWKRLADGELDALEKQPWKAGYGVE